MNPIEEFEAQGALEPGQEGWWKVWGARPHDVRPGDIVLVKTDDVVETLYVEDTFQSKAYPMRVGYVVNGEQTTLGALCKIVLVRKGTHNTLA